MFKITQSIKNNSNKAFQFFPYAQITRNYKPEVTPIYILHEGFLGVFGDELNEKDYGDIDDDKFTINIREFNKFVSEDKRVEQIIIPLGDGMTVCRVL